MKIVLHLCFLAPQLVSQLLTSDDLLLFASNGVLQIVLLTVISAAGASSIGEAAKGCALPNGKQCQPFCILHGLLLHSHRDRKAGRKSG